MASHPEASARETAASFLGRVRSLTAAHVGSDREGDMTHDIPSTPASITGSMMVYQARGLQWLLEAHDSGRGVLLADQMGMGKTLQVIALLAVLKHQRGTPGPHLVITTQGMVRHWARELARWCPSLTCLNLTGPKAERARLVERLQAETFDVVVTQFEVAILEPALRGLAWHYVIIDEVGRLVNPEARLAQQLLAIPSDHRLAMSAAVRLDTLPRVLAVVLALNPSLVAAEDKVSDYVEGLADIPEAMPVLSKMLAPPFCLRRGHEEASATAVRALRDQVLYVGLSAMQAKLYRQKLEEYPLPAEPGAEASRALVHLLVQLRKVCNHPYLFADQEPAPAPSTSDHLWENSRKLAALRQVLLHALPRGKRVMIATQSSRMLDIVEDAMPHVPGAGVLRVDGSTPRAKRDEIVTSFNTKSSGASVLLVTTRTVLGLRLEGVGVVVLYDQSRAKEHDTAVIDCARTSRYADVLQVYRLVCRDSAEDIVTSSGEHDLYARMKEHMTEWADVGSSPEPALEELFKKMRHFSHSRR